MIVEELAAKLGFRVGGLGEAQKFIRVLEQVRKAAKDAGRSMDTGLAGRNSGFGRITSEAERAAKAIRQARIEAERLSRVRIRSGGYGPGGGFGVGGYGRSTRRSGGGHSGGGNLAEAGLAGAGLGMGRVGVAAATAYGTGRVAQAALKSSMDFERAMIEVVKATDANTAERAQYEKDITRLARDTGQNKEGLAGMLSQAGFAGIPKKDLTQFTKFGAMASTAWQTTPEATGQSLAEIKNIYQASQDRLEEIGNQINFAADSSASKEVDLLEITRRVGSTAKTAGLSVGDLLSMGASLKERGVQTEIAASGIEDFINFMKLGEKYSDGAGEGLKKLGYSSDKLRKSFVAMPMETIMKFLDKIDSIKDPMKRAEALTGIFGKTRQDDVERLANASKSIRENAAKFNDKNQYSGTVKAQFDEQMKNDVSKIDQATQQIDVALKRVGDPLKQGLGYVAEKFNKTMDAIDDRTYNKTANYNAYDELPGLGGSGPAGPGKKAIVVPAISADSFQERFGTGTMSGPRMSFLPGNGAGMPRAWRTKGGGLSLGYGTVGMDPGNAPTFGANNFGIGGVGGSGKGLDWANRSAQQTVQNITNNTNTGNDQRTQSVTVNQTVNGVPGVAQAAASGVSSALSGMGPSLVKGSSAATGSDTAP